MKRLLIVAMLGIFSMSSFISCSNAENEQIEEKITQKESDLKISSRERFEEGVPVEITPEIQEEIDAVIGGYSEYGKIICSVGVGSIRGHMCVEIWGTVFNYSWSAQVTQGPGGPYYQINPDTGSYFYNYSFTPQKNCGC